MATACPKTAEADRKISARAVVMRDIIDSPLKNSLYPELSFSDPNVPNRIHPAVSSYASGILKRCAWGIWRRVVPGVHSERNSGDGLSARAGHLAIGKRQGHPFPGKRHGTPPKYLSLHHQIVATSLTDSKGNCTTNLRYLTTSFAPSRRLHTPHCSRSTRTWCRP